ncbi:hypothetical protein QTH89_05180 [Variovorax sp. J22G21]|uniref:hypothetical protein n=1 Tax=Variovorax fucosicus TaxID=3053517 RepID=UPI002577E226|nr:MULTISPECIES: hypothetical protein [unclassified Variovorax]MDM0041538.1 hypothetical protein [Variovorax sp. J22R193]MDM0060594.1 hypothetical protein [Variovorax sp. J22G21]
MARTTTTAREPRLDAAEVKVGTTEEYARAAVYQLKRTNTHRFRDRVLAFKDIEIFRQLVVGYASVAMQPA